jgi:hypothetical protein
MVYSKGKLMADNQSPQAAAAPRREHMLAAGLVLVALLVAVGSVLWTGLELARLAQQPDTTVAMLALSGLQFMAGLGFALLLWAVGEIVRNSARLADRLAAPAAVAREPVPGGAILHELRDQLSELTALTREMRDIALLDEKERSLRMQTQAAELAARLEEVVPALLHDHNWQEAHRQVQSARERFPSLPNWAALEQQIEQTRDQFERHDIEVVSRQVSDLAMVGAWGRVAEAVRELVQRHPYSSRVAQFAQRIRAERDKAEQLQRARLIAQAQEATDRRDWTAALSAVTTLLRDYPASAEADELRQQLPTLTQNAEIQTRRRMEHDIQEYIRQQRYEEALQVARELVARYPNSPQAAVLRDQLPRLEQKASELQTAL